MITACGRTSAKGLNVKEWTDGGSDAPTKNFWAARTSRGIAGQQLTEAQWNETRKSDEIALTEISLGTSQYNQTETLSVRENGDVLFERYWFSVTGVNDVRESYNYVGTLNAETVNQFKLMDSAMANSDLSELGRAPCPDITSQFAFFNRLWRTGHWDAAKLDFKRGTQQCVITVAPATQAMRTFVAWTSYLYKYATQQQ